MIIGTVVNSYDLSEIRDTSIMKDAKLTVPDGITSSLICAGKTTKYCLITIIFYLYQGDYPGGWGSCKGDSGGPLVIFKADGPHIRYINFLNKFDRTLFLSFRIIQVGIVHGSLGSCGNQRLSWHLR